MSNRRNLKKYINETMDLLYTDCLVYKLYVIDADTEAADTIIKKIVDIQDDLVKRVSASEGKDVKGRVKAYYKKLRADIKDNANTIAKDIASLSK